jgi:hypothetical protein
MNPLYFQAPLLQTLGFAQAEKEDSPVVASYDLIYTEWEEQSHGRLSDLCSLDEKA